MIFDDSEDRQVYLDSFGITEDDVVKVVSACELNGKVGTVYQVRLGFGEPLYNISFYDGWGSIKSNRFSRQDLELVTE